VVLDHWDLSDHYPVKLALQGLRTLALTGVDTTQPTTTKRKRILVNPERRGDVSTSNYWSILAEDFNEVLQDDDVDSTTQLNTLAQKWEDTCHSVAEELGLHKKPVAANEIRVSRKVHRAISRRRTQHIRVLQAERIFGFGSTAAYRAHEKYRVVARRTKRLIRIDSRKHWYRQIQQSLHWMTSKPRCFWQWARQRGNWKSGSHSSGILPIYHEDGHLLTAAPDIAERWNRHFQQLLMDITGHSRNDEYWQPMDQEPRNPSLDELNNSITREEVWEALRKAKNHKAPGMDGIPMDFLKAALEEKRRLDTYYREAENSGSTDEPPALPMTECLTKIVNITFSLGTIPDLWEQSELIPLPKKGDLADPNNYRGISLMATTLKVITIVLSERLSEQAERHNLFSVTQAGFRRKEECITQAACLIEILQRRKIAKARTYVTFIDFAKAYDTVPHGALFAKLSRFGVRGRCLNFLKGLYAKSTVTVRLGVGESVIYSAPNQLLRGLRQGCPLSPVLFNIFINDIFEYDNDLTKGAVVPYGPSTTQYPLDFRAPGVLFADDCATISPSVEAVKACCLMIDQWCVANEMSVGIRKCGILEVCPAGLEKELTEVHPLRQDLIIQGNEVPIVDEYVYLGLNLSSDLSTKGLAEGRVALGKRKVGALLPFLTCPVLPLAMRLRVIQAVILPTLLYGAEVYGMNRAITDSMQTLANKCFRAILGIRVRSIYPVPSIPLWYELGQQPICALAAGYKARAFQKGSTLKTQISRLIREPLGGRAWTWVSGTMRWYKQHCRPHVEALSNTGGGTVAAPGSTATPAAVHKCVRDAITWREMQIRLKDRRQTATDTHDYVMGEPFKQASTSLVKSRVGSKPLQVHLLKWIMRFRIGAVNTSIFLAEQGKIAPEFKDRCPFCGGEPETRYHMVFECSRWRVLRQAHIAQLLVELESKTWEILMRDQDGEFAYSIVRLNVLLGGTYFNLGLPNWTPPSPSLPNNEEDEDSLGGSAASFVPVDPDEEESVGTDPSMVAYGGNNSYRCFQVGLFLFRLMSFRAQLLLPLFPQGREAPNTTSGPRPNG